MKNKTFLIILGFILLLIAFWWFQVRPAQIKSACSKQTTEKLQAETEGRSVEEWQKRYNLYYEACMNRAGL